METFCTEPLQLNDRFSTQFIPDFWKRARLPVHYTYISFLNVPSEAEEDGMTRFVQQHATIIGIPRYPLKKLEDIKYLTGTQVYRVIRITQHIPRLISLYGRQIKWIYDGQPDHQSKHTREQQSDTNSDKSDQESITNNQSNTESDSEQDSTEQNNIENESEPEKETETNQQNQSSRPKSKNNNSRKKKIPTKITITTENLTEYDTSQEKDNEKQPNNMQTNTKRQGNQHLPNNQNITERKKQRMHTQNTKSKEEYWIDNLPCKLTKQNYPTLSQNSKTDTNQQIQHKWTNKNQDQSSQNITIVEETLTSQVQAGKNDIEFLSPPIITKTFTSTTPDTIDTLTPSISESQTNTKKTDNDKSFPTLYKKGKIIKQETMQETALKMTQKLA